MSLNDVARKLKALDEFTIIAHISPDGDTIGSSLALLSMLKSLGKTAQVICDGFIPKQYHFMLGETDIICLPEDSLRYKNVIAVDCAAKDRLGTAQKHFDAAELSMCIDHHETNSGYAELNYIDGKAAATGEIILRLADELGILLDKEIATRIYTAILTDTGRFCYSNTTPDTHRAAARLHEAGIDAANICSHIYQSEPISKLMIQAKALENLELHFGGRLAVTTITQSEMNAVRALSGDTDGIVEILRSIEGVEVSVFIREGKDGSYKVSLRSKEYVDVSGIAKRFAGGGHTHAAGFTSYKALKFTHDQLVNLVLKQLEDR